MIDKKLLLLLLLFKVNLK